MATVARPLGKRGVLVLRDVGGRGVGLLPDRGLIFGTQQRPELERRHRHEIGVTGRDRAAPCRRGALNVPFAGEHLAEINRRHGDKVVMRGQRRGGGGP